MKIGIFDSGIGGLSVLNAFVRFPINAHYFYIADSKYAPYGLKTKEEIDQRVHAICKHFIEKLHVDLIVIACNTATATSADDIRSIYPNTPILGIEPAIKPAALHSKTHQIAIAATTLTLESNRLSQLITRFADNTKVYKLYADRWVPAIEKGILDEENFSPIIETVIEPIQNTAVDYFILGCTHFPFIESLIAKQLSPSVTLLNPASSVAKYAYDIIQKHQFILEDHSNFHYYTTGDLNTFNLQLEHLSVPVGHTEVLLI